MMRPMKPLLTLKPLCALDFMALGLIVIGGLNWGLVGLFDFNLVAAILGDMSMLSRLVYILVGISAIYGAVRSPYFAHLREIRGAHRPSAA